MLLSAIRHYGAQRPGLLQTLLGLPDDIRDDHTVGAGTVSGSVRNDRTILDLEYRKELLAVPVLLGHGGQLQNGASNRVHPPTVKSIRPLEMVDAM